MPFAVPANLTVLRRCTLQIEEPASNARLSQLAQNYDILALRPVDEKTFQNTCSNLDCDLLSLDLSQRLGYYPKFKTVSDCIKRGIQIEINYTQGLLGDANAKKNLIANAVQMIRATRGRGIVISSEARKALGCRGPWDVVNLAAIWGLPQDRAYEAVSTGARSVVAMGKLKRTSYRGIVDVVYGGEHPAPLPVEAQTESAQDMQRGKKRKMADIEPGQAEASGVDKPSSKREQKRRAKQAREQTLQAANKDV